MTCLALAAGLLAFPETAVNAAREAMYAWVYSVAPSLFPFMALMPTLTCPEAVNLYERLLGRIVRPLLRLPGSAAPAVVIAMTAGSPAGALAAVRCGLNQRDLTRIVGCACGLSPMFLIGGIGASMLGNAAYGRILLRSQLAAQGVLLILSRFIGKSGPATERRHPSARQDSIPAAVTGILTVCGYMIAFSVAAAVIARICHNEIIGIAALALMDAPSGARAIAQLSISVEEKLMILSAVIGFGGLCILAQNVGASGVRLRAVLPARAIAAVISATATRIQLGKTRLTTFNLSDPMAFSTLCAAVLLIPAWISLGNTSFLNKRKSDKSSRKNLEKPKNPQHLVDNMEKCVKMM